MIHESIEKTVPGNNLGQSGQGNRIFSLKLVDSIVNAPRNLIPVKHVFGDFVFENEITIIGGSTNTAKSVLGMDIALGVTANIHHWQDSFACDVHGKTVVIDTELSDAQFARRYPSLVNSGSLFRASFWKDAYGHAEMMEVIEAIEELFVYGESPKVIILDNLTTMVSVTSSKDSQIFLQELKRIKETYGCSLIIITHTNKSHTSHPIEMDDFRGTKMIMNIADQVLAMGNTIEGNDMKYIKILKSRNIRIPEEVFLVRISNENYLHLEYADSTDEQDLLPKHGKRGPSSSITELQAERILEMDAQGVSIRGIAETMGISKSTVHRFLKSERPDEVL